MAFINENFLLHSKTARRLYEEYAAEQPIFDFHCHLSPKEIAENRQFKNLFEIWLEGDHYKWRAMRTNGVAERFCTDDVDPYEKFLAWAKTVPYTLRNPLYHWTHLELKRYFGIDVLLDESSARKVWERANEQLGELTTRRILEKFGVQALCTTDDPADSLKYHEKIEASGFPVKIFPAFRPDKAMRVEDASAFNEWVKKLGAAADVEIGDFRGLLDALQKRHDAFHQHGCRLSDHGIDLCFAEPCTHEEAEAIFRKVHKGADATPHEAAKFASLLMLFFAELDAEKGWTKQLHLGALRNANSRMFKALGRDTGFDSIGDWRQAGPLVNYLDRLDRDSKLPKMIVYNLNPADDYIFATLIGNFQDGSVAGKVQFGSAWWFLDQKEGIEWQLNALSNCGLLSRFVGMITDSRSFMSFPRHEYFRRVLCNLVGAEMENGLLPDSMELVGSMVRNICFNNAVQYFRIPGVEASERREVVAGPASHLTSK